MLSTPIDRFRAIALAEGVSFLVLLGIAMPLKYYADKPEAVFVVGWIHGILFLLYALAVLHVRWTEGWSDRKVFMAMVAAVLPFGPFVFDARLRRESTSADTASPDTDANV